MRAAKARWPQLGAFGLAMLTWFCFIVFDLACETVWMHSGVMTYAGGTDHALGSGHYYQLPWYEPIMLSMTLASWPIIRYFLNDRGETIAERGLNRVGLTGGRRTLVRFLAIVGLLNVVFIVTYQIPINFAATHISSWPADIVNRSYFRNGLCGPGTSYHCPSSQLPAPRPDGAHVGLDGSTLVMPGGTVITDQTVPSTP